MLPSQSAVVLEADINGRKNFIRSSIWRSIAVITPPRKDSPWLLCCAQLGLSPRNSLPLPSVVTLPSFPIPSSLLTSTLLKSHRLSRLFRSVSTFLATRSFVPYNPVSNQGNTNPVSTETNDFRLNTLHERPLSPLKTLDFDSRTTFFSCPASGPS